MIIKLANKSLNPLPDEKLDIIEKNIQQQMQWRMEKVKKTGSFLPGFRRYEPNEVEEAWDQQLLSEWQRKRSQRKIFYFNDEIHKALGIGSEYCIKKCYKLTAVYVPYLDMIFVEPDVDNMELSKWVFHEIVHSYQYSTRFPIDLALLGEIATGGIKHLTQKLDKIADFLMLYYEMQANYYTMRLFPDEDWIKEGKSDTRLTVNYILSFFLLNVTSHIGYMLTFGEGWALFWREYNEWVPFVDSAFEIPDPQMTTQGDQLNLREIISLRSIGQFFNFLVETDPGFSVALSLKIEEGYFGKADFFNQPENMDQKISKILHDQYYKKIMGINIYQNRSNLFRFYIGDKNDKGFLFFQPQVKYDLGDCDAVLKYVKNGVPFIEWFRVPESLMNKCTVYSDFVFSERDKFAELFTKFGGRFFHNGTEGGGGPSLHIHPQLVIKPR